MNSKDYRNIREAYLQVYNPQELTEEQVWEEVENWVNSLLEEGYDLSDYTWEEMYESYFDEAQYTPPPQIQQPPAEVRNAPKNKLSPVSTVGTGLAAAYLGNEIGKKLLKKKPNVKGVFEELDIFGIVLEYLITEGYADTQEAALAIMGNMSEDWRESIAEDAAYNTLKGFGYPGALVSAGLNNLSGGKIAKPDQPTAKSTLAPKTPTVSSSGGAGGKVTVDKQYPATLNKEKGMKSTGETGTEYFTPNIRGTNITDLNRSKFKSVASQQYEKIPSDQASQLRTAVPKVSDQTKYDPTYKPISMRRPGNFRT